MHKHTLYSSLNRCCISYFFDVIHICCSLLHVYNLLFFLCFIQMPGQQTGTPYSVYPPQNPQSSYPTQPGFGSGYQPGYPPSSGYPPASQPSYPPQSNQPGYPSQSTYPPAQPTMPYPQSSYPPMPGAQPAAGAGFSYPSNTSSAYPTQPSQPAYPPVQAAYPSTAPGYPASQPYPNSAPNTHYPSQQMSCPQAPITSSHFNNLSASNTCSPHAQHSFGKSNAYAQFVS